MAAQDEGELLAVQVKVGFTVPTVPEDVSDNRVTVGGDPAAEVVNCESGEE